MTLPVRGMSSMVFARTADLNTGHLDFLLRGSKVISDNPHIDLHAVADIGYIEFFYDVDGQSIQTAVIYFRADDKFVPLASTNDFSKRLEWEKAKLNDLEKWLSDNMPKLTDLGLVEVSRDHECLLQFDGIAACVRRNDLDGLLQDPRWPYFVYGIDGEKRNTDGNDSDHHSDYFVTIDHTNESIGFSIDGKFYRMTPKAVDNIPEPPIK